MDPHLLRAAQNGDVVRLNQLHQQNLLEPYKDPKQQIQTPLHIAADAGHANFVSLILLLEPDMGRVSDPQGSHPIHLAAAKGHWTSVEAMLQRDTSLGFLIDFRGRTAIHVAAAHGSVEVLERLLSFHNSFAKARTVLERDTLMHTCVRYNQLDALRAIAKDHASWRLSRDASGRTPLHLAVANGNVVIANYILREVRVIDEKKSIKQWFAGSVTRAVDYHQKEMEKEYVKEKANFILIVATVIAGATFQAGVQYAKENTGFRLCNAISFGLSIALFLLLASGGTLTHWVQTRIVLIILWASLFFLALSYGIFILKKHDDTFSKVGLCFSVLVVIAMLLVLCGHVYVFVRYVAREFFTRNKRTHDGLLDLELRSFPTETESAPFVQ